MNLQSIVEPIGNFLQWTFRYIMDPIAPAFNWACIIFLVLAITYWLRRQGKYNRKAAAEGTIK